MGLVIDILRVQIAWFFLFYDNEKRIDNTNQSFQKKRIILLLITDYSSYELRTGYIIMNSYQYWLPKTMELLLLLNV